jgi:internalin A
MGTLQRIYLDENRLPPIPPEISSRIEPKIIINYFLQLQTTSERKTLNEAKLIIVGQGGVGKTSLVKRLISDTYSPTEAKTEGIRIRKWTPSDDTNTVTLNIWDFGGQEIMHATHQFFLTK